MNVHAASSTTRSLAESEGSISASNVVSVDRSKSPATWMTATSSKVSVERVSLASNTAGSLDGAEAATEAGRVEAAAARSDGAATVA